MKTVQDHKNEVNVRAIFLRFAVGLFLGITVMIPMKSSSAVKTDLPAKALAHTSRQYNVPENRLALINSISFANKLYRANVLDKETGEIYVVSLRPFGELVNEQEVENLIETERQKAFVGKVQSNLKRRTELDPGGISKVAIWISTPEAPRETWREAINAGRSEDVLNEGRRFHAAAIAPVIQFLAARSISVRRDFPLAPIVVVEIPNYLVPELESLPQVAQILPYSTPQPDLNTSIKTIKADSVWAAGYTGAGVKVAVVESSDPTIFPGSAIPGNNPYLGPISLSAYYAQASLQYGFHAAYVAGVIGSTNPTYKGVSHGVQRPSDLLSGNGTDPGSQGLLAATDWAVNVGANIINQSWGNHPDVLCEFVPLGQGLCPSDDFNDGASDTVCCWQPGLANSIDVSVFAKHDDYLVSTYLVTITCSSGNDPSFPVKSPANGYNVIGTGSFDHNKTKSWSDDSISAFMSYINPRSQNNDREKPDVAAPGHVYSTTNGVSGSASDPWIYNTAFPPHAGTSFAAPHVAGTAALLMQAKPTLKTTPEEVKAVLMASAIHNIEGNSRLSNYDGAGGLEARAAFDTVMNGWSSWSPKGFFGQTSKSVTFNVTAGQKIRFAISWLSDFNPNTGSDTIQNLNLSVKNPSGSVVATSASFDNNFEIVEFTASVSGTYTAVISIAGAGPFDGGPIQRFGWAYYRQ